MKNHIPWSKIKSAASLLSVLVLLTIIGLVAIYSTTSVLAMESYDDSFHFVKRQLAALIIGVCLFLVVLSLRKELIYESSLYFYILGVILLILPIIPGISRDAGGASRWIKIGSFGFQPGELSKLLLIVSLAGYFSRHRSQLHTFIYGILIPITLTMGYVGLFLLQPDFGSSVIIISSAIVMALFSGANLWHVIFSASASISVGALLVMLSPYRMNRILAFLNPFSDASGKGYQLIQSLVAFQNGGFFGVGLGNSSQKLYFLPAAHTDFILSVISEELGFVACLGVLFAFLFILYRCCQLAIQSRCFFASQLILGCGLLVVLPALINVGVVTGLLPTKGMVLPLIGFGGSNLIVNYIIFGFITLMIVGNARYISNNYRIGNRFEQ